MQAKAYIATLFFASLLSCSEATNGLSLRGHDRTDHSYIGNDEDVAVHKIVRTLNLRGNSGAHLSSFFNNDKGSKTENIRSSSLRGNGESIPPINDEKDHTLPESVSKRLRKWQGGQTIITQMPIMATANILGGRTLHAPLRGITAVCSPDAICVEM
mmetsp:Transcript_22933/g.42579  ORF Transcript_22933/g.42579 Transcript_22933/m.42579 type:complete len:157 (+) Transcript_22933:209-679(+)